MERLEKELAAVLTEPPPTQGPARILVVGCEGEARAAILTHMKRRKHCCTWTESLREAHAAIAQDRFELVLINPSLPDGDGLELARAISQSTPTTRIIAIDETPFEALGEIPGSISTKFPESPLPDSTPDRVIRAMRRGVTDYLRWPDDAESLESSIRESLKKARADHQREERFDRLKTICEKLNNARQEVSSQVDILCQDLVDAYREIADQLDEVAMASEFRTLVRQELDVEDLLRTMLEYLLTKTGPTNAAVFLPDAHGLYSLGAYVNYDCPRESIALLLDHLGDAVCPQMADESALISFEDAAEFGKWIDADATYLDHSQIVAYACRHEGKCQAVVIAFRDESHPFDEDIAEAIETLRPIFAEQLDHVITIHHRAKPEWPEDALSDEDYDYDDPEDHGFDDGYTDLAA